MGATNQPTETRTDRWPTSLPGGSGFCAGWWHSPATIRRRLNMLKLLGGRGAINSYSWVQRMVSHILHNYWHCHYGVVVRVFAFHRGSWVWLPGRNINLYTLNYKIDTQILCLFRKCRCKKDRDVVLLANIVSDISVVMSKSLKII